LFPQLVSDRAFLIVHSWAWISASSCAEDREEKGPRLEIFGRGSTISDPEDIRVPCKPERTGFRLVSALPPGSVVSPVASVWVQNRAFVEPRIRGGSPRLRKQFWCRELNDSAMIFVSLMTALNGYPMHR
jgi:hypothetical protein